MATFVSVSAVLLLGLAIFLGAFTIDAHPSGSISLEVIVHFSVNTIVVLVALIFAVRAHPYSLHLIHLVGVLVFVCVGGLYQCMVGFFPLAGPVSTFHSVIPIACVVVSLWTFGYLGGYGLRSLLIGRIRNGGFVRFFDRPVGTASVHFSLIVGLGALIYLASLGLVGAFTRAAAGEILRAGTTSSFALINVVFIRAIPLLAVAGTILAIRNGKMSMGIGLLLPMLVIDVIGVALTNSPFAAARYWFVAVVIGLSAPHFLRRRRTGVPLLVCIVLGITILPALGNARDAQTMAEIVQHYIQFASPFDYLASSGDVDSFGTMALALQWLEINGPRWGMQLFGVLTFWVPRVVWPGKPIGTGAMVTEEMGFDFTNIAVPILTEPLVDFGLIGVPIFAFAFGWLLSVIDSAYWAEGGGHESPTGCRRIDIIYPFWVGLMIFITRGDLLSSFAYTVGVTLAMFPFIVAAPTRIRTRVEDVGANQV